jgi:hypothetical protein
VVAGILKAADGGDMLSPTLLQIFEKFSFFLL